MANMLKTYNEEMLRDVLGRIGIPIADLRCIKSLVITFNENQTISVSHDFFVADGESNAT